MSNLSNVVPGAEGPGEFFSLGGAEPQGRASLVPGGVDLTAAGADFWAARDEGGFVGRQFTGDFDLKVRVAASEGLDHYTKAGLMARAGLEAGDPHVFLLTFPADGPRNKNSGMIEAQVRSAPGAECFALYPPAQGAGAPEFPVAFPQVWLRLGRRGSVWTLSVGNDGRTWRVYAEVEVPFPARVWAGPAYTSHRAGTLGTAQFRELS